MKKASSILYIILSVILIYFLSPRGGTWFYIHKIRWLYVLILSAGFAFLFTPLARLLSFKTKVLDMPGERKIHTQPMPLLGGLAIYSALIITIVRNLRFIPELTGIIIGASIVFLMGLLDDVKGIRGRYRLAGQILAALIIIAFGVRITVIPKIPGEYFIEVLLTIIGVVGITNAFNYFDGMDGLAAGLGIVTSFCFFIVALQTGQRHVSWLAIALLGVCLGFLPHNWKPANIFLGDSGANLIGFILASLAIMESWGVQNPVVASAVPVLILSIYIFDMVYTSVARLRYKNIKTFTDWLEYAGKDHLHHRLVRLKFSDQGAVLTICMLSLSLGISALVLRRAGATESALLIAQALFIYLIIVFLMLAGRTIAEDKNEG
jgi:UDP-GlcNAc:undecaprenyl-phosphate GlcNAc-1-phosphate transferase